MGQVQKTSYWYFPTDKTRPLPEVGEVVMFKTPKPVGGSVRARVKSISDDSKRATILLASGKALTVGVGSLFKIRKEEGK